jgi:hypothetical protein
VATIRGCATTRGRAPRRRCHRTPDRPAATGRPAGRTRAAAPSEPNSSAACV